MTRPHFWQTKFFPLAEITTCLELQTGHVSGGGGSFAFGMTALTSLEGTRHSARTSGIPVQSTMTSPPVREIGARQRKFQGRCAML